MPKQREAMRVWKGDTVAEGLTMFAKVSYVLSDSPRTDWWEGVGWSALPWPSWVTIETSIGPIIVVDPVPMRGPSGFYRVRFCGNGDPTGPLVEKMGISRNPQPVVKITNKDIDNISKR